MFLILLGFCLWQIPRFCGGVDFIGHWFESGAEENDMIGLFGVLQAK